MENQSFNQQPQPKLDSDREIGNQSFDQSHRQDLDHSMNEREAQNLGANNTGRQSNFTASRGPHDQSFRSAGSRQRQKPREEQRKEMVAPQKSQNSELVKSVQTR